MDTEISEAIEALRMDMRRLEMSLRAEMRQIPDEIRRHFDVAAESLRDDIRMVAEGLAALDVKVESLRPSSGLR